jgi:hypothetical protein
MKKLLLFLVCIYFTNAFAQEETKTTTNDRVYGRSAGELIFSMGKLSIPGADVKNVLRFSAFYHFQRQLHIDFSNMVGMYTGFGVRNVGFINEINDSIKLKQRSYSIGIPLALKVGNVKDGAMFAIGAEVEYMFAYKQKFFLNDQKYKFSEWFSDRVNPINPSVFAEIHFGKGSYLRFKYYLMDFLDKDNQRVNYNSQRFTFTPNESKLFYVSIGSTFKMTRKDKKNQKSSNI